MAISGEKEADVLAVCLALSLGHAMASINPPKAGPNTQQIAYEVLRALAVRGWKLIDTNGGGDENG